MKQVIILLGKQSSGKSHWAMNHGPLYSFVADHNMKEIEKMHARLQYRLIEKDEPGVIIKGIYTKKMLDAVYSYLINEIQTHTELNIVFMCFTCNKKTYINTTFATMADVEIWMQSNVIG